MLSINYVMTQILKLSCASFSYVNISYVLAAKRSFIEKTLQLEVSTSCANGRQWFYYPPIVKQWCEPLVLGNLLLSWREFYVSSTVLIAHKWRRRWKSSIHSPPKCLDGWPFYDVKCLCSRWQKCKEWAKKAEFFQF